MTPHQTKLLIGAGALLTAGLVWFAPSQEAPTVSEPAKATKALKLRTPGVEASPLDAAAKSLDMTLKNTEARAHLTKKDASALFAKSSWIVVPPPPKPVIPPPPPPPPPPTAPALPYGLMGKFEQGDTNLVILTRGNRVITAAQGDVLENTYRIERIEASKVTFTYLPLGTAQTLSIGSTQ